MAENLRDVFERSCRLCAEEQEVSIMIFSKEAEDLLLQNKLNNYLLIEVDEDDKLPKNICIRCCTQLHSVCDFIDTARKAQEVLFSRSIILDQIAGDPLETPSIVSEIKTEPDMFLEEEDQVTAMEVSVDPMMVLQNSESVDMPTSDTEDKLGSNELSYIQGLESENVTIKLIRRSGTPRPDSPDCLDGYDDPKKKGENGKPFPCVICQRSFLTELALKNHSWIHLNDDKSEKMFKCSSCDVSFDYKCDLVAHLKLHRSIGRCKICSRVFRTEANLAIHMESHTSTTNAFMCKVCGRAYNTSSNLKTHSITHSNERPYQCHLCKKSFKRNQDLKFHINQHTGAKPYKCPFCDKCFASSGNCYSHRSRMHPGRRVESKVTQVVPPTRLLRVSPAVPKDMKPWGLKGINKYQCQICNHSFVKRDNFTYHMYQHTGEKPFQCTFCSDKFVTRRGLLIHHDKSHPAQERPLVLLSKNALLQ